MAPSDKRLRSAIRGAEHAVVVLAAAYAYKTYRREGAEGVARLALAGVRALPGVEGALSLVLDREVQGAVKLLTGEAGGSGGKPTSGPAVTIPAKGVPAEELLAELRAAKETQMHSHEGKTFAYVYEAAGGHSELVRASKELFAAAGSEHGGGGDEGREELLRKAHDLFMHDNALNPNVFPALRRFEVETCAMAAGMLNGDGGVVGSLTSGGTESVIMAMKAYRDRARKLSPWVRRPEVVACETVHPAFEKAAHYFDMVMVHVPTTADLRMDVAAAAAAVTRNTVLLVGSAPQYCHGVVDPIEELSALAVSKGLPLHVDACFGGYMLPWVEKIGYEVPKWDFRVPGVTSISADLHKYGFGPKGASTLLYRSKEIRQYQYFAYAKFPGGLFGSPSMAGTRPGGTIAAAWACLKAMGEDGYVALARELMEVTEAMKAGVNAIGGLKVLGAPHMTGFAFCAQDPKVDIFAVADAMERRGGWKMERQQFPASCHCSVMPNHRASKSQFLADLEASVEEVRARPELCGTGTASMYGMVGAIPDKTLVDDFIVKYLNEVYTA